MQCKSEKQNQITKAKFKLDFKINACLDIDQEMKITLFDGSLIVFHKSKVLNLGTIFFEIDQPDEIIAKNKGQQRVEDFLNCMLITSNAENLEPINFPRKPELINPEDFVKVPKIRYKSLLADIILVAKFQQRELDAVSDMMSKINKLPQEKRGIILRSLHWFRKASEAKGEDVFVYRWISFDALLGLLKKRKATQNLILEFVDRFLKTEIARKIFDKHQKTIEDLSKLNLVSRGGVPYSKQLCELLEKRCDPRAILPKATQCIFEVRNNLFHKGEALEVMRGSSLFLRDIIRECLKQFCI